MKYFLILSLFLTSFLSADSFDGFETLMGKNTSHWRHIEQPKDWEFFYFAKELYEKNVKAQYSNEGLYKIPPVVHFIWLGPRPFPPTSVENVRTWMAQNPGWKVKFWTDKDREPPCEGMERVLVKDFHFQRLGRCFEESQNYGEKSDILRFEILYQEGGVYADHDANCLRPFDGMHRGFDLFCCLETPHVPFVGRAITCGIGLLGSRPRHPTIEKAIDLIQRRWDILGDKYRGQDPYSKAEVVMQRTYIALTDALKGTIDQKGNVDILLPSAYFFSKSGIPSLYSKHFYNTTWDEGRERKTEMEKSGEKALGRILLKQRHLSWVIYGLIGMNALLLLFAVTPMRKRK